MTPGFELHPRLAGDTHRVGELPLCTLLLMDDRQYPWFILVPRQPGLREIHELAAAARTALWDESHALALAMCAAFAPDKLNVAALGNVVPQLHLHHVARYRSDVAWPAPVWGRVAAVPYAPDEREPRIAALRAAWPAGMPAPA